MVQELNHLKCIFYPHFYGVELLCTYATSTHITKLYIPKRICGNRVKCYYACIIHSEFLGSIVRFGPESTEGFFLSNPLRSPCIRNGINMLMCRLRQRATWIHYCNGPKTFCNNVQTIVVPWEQFVYIYKWIYGSTNRTFFGRKRDKHRSGPGCQYQTVWAIVGKCVSDGPCCHQHKEPGRKRSVNSHHLQDPEKPMHFFCVKEAIYTKFRQRLHSRQWLMRFPIFILLIENSPLTTPATRRPPSRLDLVSPRR